MQRVTATGPAIRAVTADEVAFYRENGWARLPGLIPPELALEMVATASSRMLGSGARFPEHEDALIEESPSFRYWFFVSRDQPVEPIRSVAFGPEMGRNAQVLIGRDTGVNYFADDILVKMPGRVGGSRPTSFHQDLPNFPFDRPGFLTFWIALDELLPEQGTLRFYSGSHREGPLPPSKFSGGELDEQYRDIVKKYPLSQAVSMAPGDATVHSGLVLHGAPGNSTDRPRWALQLGYFPDDTCYTGGTFPATMMLDDVRLQAGEPVRHPVFPSVCPKIGAGQRPLI